MECPDCGSIMILRRTTKFKTKDGKDRMFWGCSKWPECNATHGAHPDGTPLGIPANKKTKEMRMRVHRLLEQNWGEWRTTTKKQKQQMYAWLKKNAPKEHIAEMTYDELIETEKILIENGLAKSLGV